MAKQYIYKPRCFKKELVIYNFKSTIYLLRHVEKYNTIVSNKLDKHMAKWKKRFLRPTKMNKKMIL